MVSVGLLISLRVGERNREQASKRGKEDLNSVFTRVKAIEGQGGSLWRRGSGVRGIASWGFEGAEWHK